jgi:hypothetical protein
MGRSVSLFDPPELHFSTLSSATLTKLEKSQREGVVFPPRKRSKVVQLTAAEAADAEWWAEQIIPKFSTLRNRAVAEGVTLASIAATGPTAMWSEEDCKLASSDFHSAGMISFAQWSAECFLST